MLDDVGRNSNIDLYFYFYIFLTMKSCKIYLNSCCDFMVASIE